MWFWKKPTSSKLQDWTITYNSCSVTKYACLIINESFRCNNLPFQSSILGINKQTHKKEQFAEVMAEVQTYTSKT